MADLSLRRVTRATACILAGYGLDQLDLAYSGGIPEIHLAGEAWGSATVAVGGNGLANVSGRLRNAPVDRVLAFVAPEAAAVVPGPVTLDRLIDGTLSTPSHWNRFPAEQISWPRRQGERATHIDGAQGSRGRCAMPVSSFPGSPSGGGEDRPGGLIEGPSISKSMMPLHWRPLFEAWLPGLEQFGLAGGPMTIDADFSGSLADPAIRPGSSGARRPSWEPSSNSLGRAFGGSRRSRVGRATANLAPGT